jgi:hypothetical protein
MFLDLIKINERLLINMSNLPSVIRVGATDKIKERHNEYRRIGYEGTMYYTMTDNMRQCEDLCLLSARHGGVNCSPYNSISPRREGYVYIIQGKCPTD